MQRPRVWIPGHAVAARSWGTSESWLAELSNRGGMGGTFTSIMALQPIKGHLWVHTRSRRRDAVLRVCYATTNGALANSSKRCNWMVSQGSEEARDSLRPPWLVVVAFMWECPDDMWELARTKLEKKIMINLTKKISSEWIEEWMWKSWLPMISIGPAL